MDEAGPLEILEDMPLPGPAEVLADLGEDDDEAARAISERMREQGVAVPGARFGMDDLRRLVGRLRGRTLVNDLCIHEAKVDWLGVHVPPGGSASLELHQEAANAGSVRLKFMGLGFGSGHSVKLSASQGFGDRSACFAVGETLLVRLRTYRGAGPDGESLQVDVDQVLGSYISSRQSCDRCFTAPNLGFQPRRLEREWDLTEDPHGLTETVTYELGETQAAT